MTESYLFFYDGFIFLLHWRRVAVGLVGIDVKTVVMFLGASILTTLARTELLEMSWSKPKHHTNRITPIGQLRSKILTGSWGMPDYKSSHGKKLLQGRPVQKHAEIRISGRRDSRSEKLAGQMQGDGRPVHKGD